LALLKVIFYIYCIYKCNIFYVVIVDQLSCLNLVFIKCNVNPMLLNHIRQFNQEPKLVPVCPCEHISVVRDMHCFMQGFGVQTLNTPLIHLDKHKKSLVKLSRENLTKRVKVGKKQEPVTYSENCPFYKNILKNRNLGKGETHHLYRLMRK